MFSIVSKQVESSFDVSMDIMEKYYYHNHPSSGMSGMDGNSISMTASSSSASGGGGTNDKTEQQQK